VDKLWLGGRLERGTRAANNRILAFCCMGPALSEGPSRAMLAIRISGAVLRIPKITAEIASGGNPFEVAHGERRCVHRESERWRSLAPTRVGSRARLQLASVICGASEAPRERAADPAEPGLPPDPRRGSRKGCMAAPKTRTPTTKVEKKTSAKKATSTTKKPPKGSAPEKPRVFAMSFASVYPLYVQKAEKKGRTKAEVDEVIAWLTGYEGKGLQRAIDAKVDIEAFFAHAPRMNPNAVLITGLVCGVRVEEVADPLMRKVRYLDKLIDELARGKKMASILRE